MRRNSSSARSEKAPPPNARENLELAAISERQLTVRTLELIYIFLAL
jgi:hypothetical protein